MLEISKDRETDPNLCVIMYRSHENLDLQFFCKTIQPSLGFFLFSFSSFFFFLIISFLYDVNVIRSSGNGDLALKGTCIHIY